MFSMFATTDSVTTIAPHFDQLRELSPIIPVH